MANYEQLKSSVATVIKENGNEEITGLVMQNVLNTIISTIGENSTFVGLAVPNTNPGIKDANVFYMCNTPGVYINFSTNDIDVINIDNGEICFLKNDNNNKWVKIPVLNIAQYEGLNNNSPISQLVLKQSTDVVYDYINNRNILLNISVQKLKRELINFKLLKGKNYIFKCDYIEGKVYYAIYVYRKDGTFFTLFSTGQREIKYTPTEDFDHIIVYFGKDSTKDESFKLEIIFNYVIDYLDIKTDNTISNSQSFFKNRINKENAYINLLGNEVGLVTPNSFYIEYFDVTKVKSINVYTNNWSGSDDVSIISCYDSNNKYIGNLLEANSIIDKRINGLVIENIQNAAYIKVTNRLNNKVVLGFNVVNNFFLEDKKKDKNLLMTKGIIYNNGSIYTDKETDIGVHSANVYDKTKLNQTGFKFKVLNDTTNFRCFFGNSNFFKYFVLSIVNNKLTVELYNSINGVLEIVSSISNDSISKIKMNDYFTITKIGECYIFYINNKLIGSINSINNNHLNTPYLSGIMFRDKNDTNIFSELEYINSNKTRYSHISVDDVNGLLKVVSENQSLQSIWENETFSFLKKMNAKYGAVFSLYLFKNYPSFDISNFPIKFKKELNNASSWLKFGFHAKEDVHYDQLSKDIVVTDYNDVYKEVIRFAGESSFDYIPRFHYYSVNRDAIFELNKLGRIKGLLTADDTRVSNVGLNEIERDVVNSCDYLADYERDLMFYKTSVRYDNNTVQVVEDKIQTEYQDVNNSYIQILFFHEPYLMNNKQGVEKMVETLKSLNYTFCFPQNFNLNK